MEGVIPTSSGMVTYSAENPTDEIPVGPQAFPYGNPLISESNVEPYLASNYQTGVTSEIPTTGDYQLGGVQTGTVTTNYIQPDYQTYSTPQTSYQYTESPVTYDAGAYQTTEFQGANYQTLSAPQMTTQYETVTSYQPVTSTEMVPQVTTGYVAAPSTTGVGDTFTPSPVPTPDLVAQQPLPDPNTVPLL